jgi:sporulation protein YlmC with PRC-barrel domain
MIRASDLVGCVVRTETGVKLGRVHDLRAEATAGGGWRLIGLVVGRQGILTRLAGDATTSHGRNYLPWQDILALDDGLVTVRAKHPDH